MRLYLYLKLDVFVAAINSSGTRLRHKQPRTHYVLSPSHMSVGAVKRYASAAYPYTFWWLNVMRLPHGEHIRSKVQVDVFVCISQINHYLARR